MNYLAHLYLATVPTDLSKRQASLTDGTDESLVGSLVGDFVKGDDHHGYSVGIRRAILIHRKIDAYSNAHPVYRRSKRRIHSSYRHTRGILVDLFYDHFLARDWDTYTDEALPHFSRRVYRALRAHQDALPPRLQSILTKMATDDWLLSYREVTNIALALAGLSLRLTRRNELARGLEELRRNYTGLEGDSRAFFPQLVDCVANLKEGAP